MVANAKTASAIAITEMAANSETVSRIRNFGLKNAKTAIAITKTDEITSRILNFDLKIGSKCRNRNYVIKSGRKFTSHNSHPQLRFKNVRL